MALSDRLRTKLTDTAEKTKAVAADGAGAAAAKAKAALEARSGTAGPRLLALLQMDDDAPLTIEALVVGLVDAVRKDDEARELSDRDVFKAAKRRFRRLGVISLPTGPVGWRVVGLYCEAATVCDIVELRGEPLSDEAVAAHLVVLWDAMPDLAGAEAAIAGTGQSVLQALVLRYRAKVAERLPDPMTKRAVVTLIWRQRGLMSDVREAATPGVRENVFPGKRVKAFIAQAHAQLDGTPTA